VAPFYDGEASVEAVFFWPGRFLFFLLLMSLLARLVRQAPSLENITETLAYTRNAEKDEDTVDATTRKSHQRLDRLRECPELYHLRKDIATDLESKSQRNAIVRRSDSGYESILEKSIFYRNDELHEDLMYIDETYYSSMRPWDQEEMEAGNFIVSLQHKSEQEEIEECENHPGWSKVILQDTNPELTRYGGVQRIEATHKSIVRLNPNITLLSPTLTHLNL
jgi:hypothetical protein